MPKIIARQVLTKERREELDALATACRSQEFCALLDQLVHDDKLSVIGGSLLASKEAPPSLQEHRQFCVDVVWHCHSSLHPAIASTRLARLGLELRDPYFFQASKTYECGTPIKLLVDSVVRKVPLPSLPKEVAGVLDAWAGQDPDVLQVFLDMAPPQFEWNDWHHVKAHLEKQALLEASHKGTPTVGKKM